MIFNVVDSPNARLCRGQHEQDGVELPHQLTGQSRVEIPLAFAVQDTTTLHHLRGVLTYMTQVIDCKNGFLSFAFLVELWRTNNFIIYREKMDLFRKSWTLNFRFLAAFSLLPRPSVATSLPNCWLHRNCLPKPKHRVKELVYLRYFSTNFQNLQFDCSKLLWFFC